MILLRAVLIIFCAVACTGKQRVRLEAKKIIKGKVLANGYSISAKSLSHCIEYCNRHNKTCDGIVFTKTIEKCRLVNKCAAAYQVDNSSSSVYYSRRPQILFPGYVYDVQTNSCIGLIKTEGNYAEADNLCRKQNASLLIINQEKLNQVAKLLLMRYGITRAWINYENVAHETTIKPHGISGNDVLPQKVFSPEVLQRRNEIYKSCWGIDDQGRWSQFSCKNETMAPLCQVFQF